VTEPLTIDPDAYAERLQARYVRLVAELMAENARLETALSAALDRLNQTNPEGS
jgi:hypothetical protein